MSPADEYLFGLSVFQEGVWNWRGMPQQLRQFKLRYLLPMIVSSHGYGLLWNNASLTDFNPADQQVTLTNGVGSQYHHRRRRGLCLFRQGWRPPPAHWRAGQRPDRCCHHEHVGDVHCQRQGRLAGQDRLFRESPRRRQSGEGLCASPW